MKRFSNGFIIRNFPVSCAEYARAIAEERAKNNNVKSNTDINNKNEYTGTGNQESRR